MMSKVCQANTCIYITIVECNPMLTYERYDVVILSMYYHSHIHVHVDVVIGSCMQEYHYN